MRLTRQLLLTCAVFFLSGCFETARPRPTANLKEVIERVRSDLIAAQLAPGEKAATPLTLSEATLVLKIAAEGGSGMNAGVDVPLKIGYSVSGSDSLENTITIKYSLPGTPGNPTGSKSNPLDVGPLGK
ncbi:trypco2 family protein [Variovorax sp. ZT4R33]|uniref:trypco2 family protein n=1 Tax=Variovorax sp. ZT4R33 TaxID=3443743 RepID=UPI003F45FF21